DPGGEAKRIMGRIAALGIEIEMVVLTHFHFDHVLAAQEVAECFNAPIAIHRADAAWLKAPPPFFARFAPQPPSLEADELLEEGDLLSVGEGRIQVLHTPGHSPGGISLWSEKDGFVLTGDALFAGGVGRTDLPGSNPQELIRGIRSRLLVLPDETVVYPGHGSASTIGSERTGNPWLRG
ncbi:MAG: MBL fold metallo-hydrolase, partial [Anaerolineae bacterium]